MRHARSDSPAADRAPRTSCCLLLAGGEWVGGEWARGEWVGRGWVIGERAARRHAGGLRVGRIGGSVNIVLPVALTSPLWWVARWSSRLLTSFAVAVAFSLGGSTLPDTVALPETLPPMAALPAAGPPGAPALVPTTGTATTWALRPGYLAGELRQRQTGALVPATVGSPTHERSLGDVHPVLGRPAGPAGAPADRSAAAPGGPTVAVPALAGLSPTTAGSRAPPG